MSAFTPIIAATGRALRPLERALADPEALRSLLVAVGWDVNPAADDLGPINDLLPISSLTRAIELGQQALDGELSIGEALELADVIRDVVDAIAGWADLDLDDVADLSPTLADPDLWADLSAVLAEHLLIRLIDGEVPVLALGLRLTGVVHWEERSAFFRVGRWRLDWEQVATLFTDPLAAIRSAIGWPSPTAANHLIVTLQLTLTRLGLPVVRVPMADAVRAAIEAEGTGDAVATDQAQLVLARGTTPDGAPYEFGIVAASAATDGEPIGMYVGNLCSGALDAGVTTGIWSISVGGEVDGAATAGAVVRPGSTTPITQVPSGEAALVLRGTPEKPWRLLGSAGGTRVELAGLEIVVGLTFDPGDGDTWLELGATGSGIRAVLDLGGADSFLSSFLGGIEPDVSFPAALRLGSTSGWRVTAGGLALEFTVPIGVQLGPVYLDRIEVGIAGAGSGIDLDLGAALELEIGPFRGATSGIGTTFALTFGGSGALGGLDASIAFKPPEMIALELDTEAVTGSGIIYHDPDAGRYIGGVSLDIVSIGIDALVIVDTQLPGDPDGWAFFASLSARFPGIPLGFGFTLNGVGGLIALNRTLDAEALALGLRSGTVDALLFPDDPVGDALDLVTRIDDYFPVSAGSSVIGPVIEIGWGSPNVITGQLGVVISLPDGVIAVIGSLAAVLPRPDEPILELHMDSLGVIDIPGGTFSVLASLYDSSLLETIRLSGDMATYLQVGAQPYFLLSVGGYHPGFDPPSILPASVRELRRMQASIDIASSIQASIQAYFAVTSNSVQFGASINVSATADVELATYTARGWYGFDVLITFSPFSLTASMSAGVGIYSRNRELMGVQLELVLEGPEPWYAIGTASFRFFGLKVKFELEVGGHAAGEAPPIAHSRRDVIAALGLPSAWREIPPADGVIAGVTYTSDDPEDLTWVRPDHQIAARQGAAPLNRLLEIVGNSIPAPGESLIEVADARIGDRTDVTWDLLDDWFAPAQFEVLGQNQRLSRASYELMNAGVTFGLPGAAVTDHDHLTTHVDAGYDEEEYTPSEPGLHAAARSGAVAYALRSQPLVAPAPMFTIAPTAFTVVQTADGTEAVNVLDDAGVSTGGTSQYAAVAARSATVAAQPWRASKLATVPASAVQKAAT